MKTVSVLLALGFFCLFAGCQAAKDLQACQTKNATLNEQLKKTNNELTAAKMNVIKQVHSLTEVLANVSVRWGFRFLAEMADRMN